MTNDNWWMCPKCKESLTEIIPAGGGRVCKSDVCEWSFRIPTTEDMEKRQLK